MVENILHITTQSEWDAAQKDGVYSAPSLESQGYIHLSRKEQAPGTLKLWFKDTYSLLLLHIDPSKLSSKLVYEAPDGIHEEPCKTFPHLYGKLNLDSVVSTQAISRKEDTEWNVKIE